MALAAARAPPGTLPRQHSAGGAGQRCRPVCALPARRELLVGGAALLGSRALVLPGMPPLAVAAESAAALPLVPRGAPLGAAAVTPSAVIKGCWQLSGGHKGEADTDRTCVLPRAPCCAPARSSCRARAAALTHAPILSP
jgi:hypothetical protein